MRLRVVVSAVVVLAALGAAPPANAGPPTVASVTCEDSPAQRQTFPPRPRRTRIGPLLFNGWHGYKSWANMDEFRDRDGAAYAKAPMYARRGSISTLYVAPAHRDNVDIFYGGERADVLRISACPRRLSFYSGGLLVREPACVEIRVRERGSRRVHRHIASINAGDSCAKSR